MVLFPAALALLLQAPHPTPSSTAPEVRTAPVLIVDRNGKPVEGLTLEEVAVTENGVARDILRFERDERPLTLALVLDTGVEASTDFRLHTVPAVTSFLARLPEGTRYAIWTTGDRPTKVVDYTADVEEARKALKRVFPQGGSTLLDALVESSKDLKEVEGGRRVVVSVSGVGIGFTNHDRQQVVERGEKTGVAFWSVLYEEGSAPTGAGGDTGGRVVRQDYDFVLSSLATKTGGRHETTLAAMGIDAALRKVSTDLKGQYRLTYQGLPGAKERKLELHVARPGVKTRIGPSTTPSL